MDLCRQQLYMVGDQYTFCDDDDYNDDDDDDDKKKNKQLIYLYLFIKRGCTGPDYVLRNC